MAKLVSKVYGDALYRTAKEQGKLDEIFEEVKALQELWNLQEMEEFHRMIQNPKVSREEKKQIIENTFDARLSKEITGLLVILMQKGHYRQCESVLEYFVARAKEEKKIGVAHVTTAYPLTAEQEDAIQKKLLDTTDYNSFEMKYYEDSSLIGGMIIRIGDRIVDSSIKTKLYRLSKSLRQTQV